MSQPAVAPPARRRTERVRLRARLMRNRRVVVGLALIAGLHLAALFAPWFAPYHPDTQLLVDRLKPPSRQHLLGADHLGRDILSRVMWGARVSLAVGMVATTLTVVIGAVFGLLSGYFGA